MVWRAKNRLQLENRTEEQLRDVLRIEEDCLRGGILASLQKILKDHALTLKNMNESVVGLRSECETAQNKVNKASSLASRKNACVAIVNNLYQVLCSFLFFARIRHFVQVNLDRPRHLLCHTPLIMTPADNASR